MSTVKKKCLRDIHPNQRPGEDANLCFTRILVTPSTHESISYGKCFKELLQTYCATVHSICIVNVENLSRQNA